MVILFCAYCIFRVLRPDIPAMLDSVTSSSSRPYATAISAHERNKQLTSSQALLLPPTLEITLYSLS